MTNFWCFEIRARSDLDEVKVQKKRRFINSRYFTIPNADRLHLYILFKLVYTKNVCIS